LNATNTFSYRHFNVQDDFTALVALLNTVEQHDHDDEDVSEATLREQITWAGHDPALDRWVATLPNSTDLIGYGILFKTAADTSADLSIAVHPQWRRRGIGSELLSHLLTRSRELGVADVRIYATVQHLDANAFLRNHDFAPMASYTRMAIPGTHPFPQPDLPAGFTIRSYQEVQQIEVFVEALNRGYEGLWGHHHVSQEEVETWLPQLPPEGIFLLFAPDGTIVGISRAEMSEQLTTQRNAPTGLVDAPGVVPTYRDAGLYLPLVLTALHWLVPQTPTTIELESWGDAAGTLAVYREIGFTTVQESVSYRRVLG